MRGKLFVGVLTIAMCICFSALAEPAKPDLNDIADLFRTLHSGKSAEPVRATYTETGYVRSVGAPPGGYLDNSGGKGLNEEAAARLFLAAHAGAIANESPKLGYTGARVSKTPDRSYVRLDQTYAGLPVFGAAVSVQMDDTSNVAFFLSHLMTDTQTLDSGQVPTTPRITAGQAKQYAVEFLAGSNPGQTFAVTSSPILTIYDPSVVGNSGADVLAWKMNASNSSDSSPISEAVLVDAVNGTIALHYSLIYDAKYRQIYDAKSTATDPGFLARAEGQSPTFVTDVNQAYDFYGDTYDFYFNMFGRDSIDNKGLSLSATVQFCPSTYDCPFQNAYWDPDKLRMYFGSGWTAEEDIIAHELTHGVTQYESNLIYLNQSGAINESLSDVFGKCVALTYHDSGLPSNLRWRIGFDSPIGAFRSMSDPTIYSDPDRLHSPYYYTGQGDNGGVHINSGVSNKLCFLLTDGQFFNGVHVNPMGIPKVAQLYYEAQVHLLVPSSNYHDLYAALSQAAHNIGTTFAERQNIEAAMCAVEIAPNSVPLRHFRAQSQGASGNVTLTWENRSCGSDTLILIRKTGGFPTSQLDGTVVFAGNADSFVDPGLASGTEYFYALDAPTGDSHPFTSGALFARVVAGSPVPSSFTEQFDHGSVDLSFTQILFTPNYDIAAAAASGKPDSYVNYSDYSATVTKNISALPIPRTNAIRLFLMDDGHDWVNLSTPLPYFGGRYNRIYVQANGAVAFRVATAIYGNDSLAQPLPTNFEVPQVSFLFSELSPRSGGEAWFRFMDDRVVVTFDKIPEFGSTKTNTVQTELFYSGHIRISYMELNALNAICGLSDGRGVPPDPLTYVNNLVDLSEMGISTRFALDPIPVLSATAGDLVTFTATTTGGTPPSASVAYSAIGLPPGASINPSSGQFSWPTGLNQQGQYNPTIKAQKGADVVAQDVTIYVADANVLPVASNLTITPLKPAIGDILEGHYTYSHATGVPEGASVITWYRNGTVVPILAGQLVVPSAYLQGGDSWSFSVTPVSASGLQGAQVSSSVVVVRRLVEADVNGDGLVDAVDIQVVINAALGIDVSPYDADVNGDGHVDSIDVQLIVNSAVS